MHMCNSICVDIDIQINTETDTRVHFPIGHTQVPPQEATRGKWCSTRSYEFIGKLTQTIIRAASTTTVWPTLHGLRVIFD